MKTRKKQIEQNFQNIKDGSLIFAWEFDPLDTPFIIVAKKENDKIYARTKGTNSGVIVLDGYRKQSDTVKEFVRKVLQIGSKRPLCLFNEYKEGYIDCLDQIKELAAQYGVEVEE